MELEGGVEGCVEGGRKGRGGRGGWDLGEESRTLTRTLTFRRRADSL